MMAMIHNTAQVKPTLAKSAPQSIVWPVAPSAHQDSFVSGPHTNVTWSSWLTAVAEIGFGLFIGYAGLRSAQNRGLADIAEHEAFWFAAPRTWRPLLTVWNSNSQH
jgi:hypothetical protein